MKYCFYLLLSALSISFSGCLNKPINPAEVNYIFTGPDSLIADEAKQVSLYEYEVLQLDKISDLEYNEPASFYYGDTIVMGKNGRLQTIYHVTDTEKAEYLLTYDIANNLKDYICVSFLDWQNYHRMFSVLKEGELTVNLIESDFDSVIMNRTSDTIRTKYKIANDLTFIKEEE